MRDNDIRSLAVYGTPGHWLGAGGSELIVNNKQYIGVISMLDITHYLMEERDRRLKMPGDRDKMGISVILESRIRAVIGETSESLSLWYVFDDFNLAEVCEILCKGVHRLLVVEREPSDTDSAPARNKVNPFTNHDYVLEGEVKLMSQKDILGFLHINCYECGEYFSITAFDMLKSQSQSEFGKPQVTMKPHHLLSVNENDSLLHALRKLCNNSKVSGITAMPVFESNSQYARVTSTLSATDLKKLVEKGENVSEILLTYVLESSEDNMSVAKFLRLLNNGELPKAIVAYTNDTIDIITKLIQNRRIHQVWVIDEQGDIINVISITDIIRLLYTSLPAKLAFARHTQ